MRRTGSQRTSGAYRYHMRGRSCCEQCDYRHADCLVPSWMPWEQRIMALWTSVVIRAEAGQRVAREGSGSIAVGRMRDATITDKLWQLVPGALVGADDRRWCPECRLMLKRHATRHRAPKNNVGGCVRACVWIRQTGSAGNIHHQLGMGYTRNRLAALQIAANRPESRRSSSAAVQQQHRGATACLEHASLHVAVMRAPIISNRTAWGERVRRERRLIAPR